ncbi:MAG: glucan biosynthesis glucosyltransferase H, partial [Caulobacter sp.]
MSDRSALFDVRTSTSVSLDQVVRRDTVEIPSEAPLAMPVQPLSFWQGGARRATALIQNMTLRRWMLGLMTVAMGVAGWKASFDTIALGGVTRLEAVVVALLAPLFLALSLWFCTAFIGFVVLMGKPKDPLGIDGETPMPKLHTRTAILMPVYNEDATAVFARLRAMDASIAEAGAARNFDIFVISDTRDAQVALAEQACFARFRREASCNVYYRIRKENTGRKAGNVADWVSRWGSAYEHMLVLDA